MYFLVNCSAIKMFTQYVYLLAISNKPLKSNDLISCRGFVFTANFLWECTDVISWLMGRSLDCQSTVLLMSTSAYCTEHFGLIGLFRIFILYLTHYNHLIMIINQWHMSRIFTAVVIGDLLICEFFV